MSILIREISKAAVLHNEEQRYYSVLAGGNETKFFYVPAHEGEAKDAAESYFFRNFIIGADLFDKVQTFLMPLDPYEAYHGCGRPDDMERNLQKWINQEGGQKKAEEAESLLNEVREKCALPEGRKVNERKRIS